MILEEFPAPYLAEVNNELPPQSDCVLRKNLEPIDFQGTFNDLLIEAYVHTKSEYC